MAREKMKPRHAPLEFREQKFNFGRSSSPCHRSFTGPSDLSTNPVRAQMPSSATFFSSPGASSLSRRAASKTSSPLKMGVRLEPQKSSANSLELCPTEKSIVHMLCASPTAPPGRSDYIHWSSESDEASSGVTHSERHVDILGVPDGLVHSHDIVDSRKARIRRLLFAARMLDLRVDQLATRAIGLCHQEKHENVDLENTHNRDSLQESTEVRDCSMSRPENNAGTPTHVGSLWLPSFPKESTALLSEALLSITWETKNKPKFPRLSHDHHHHVAAKHRSIGSGIIGSSVPYPNAKNHLLDQSSIISQVAQTLARSSGQTVSFTPNTGRERCDPPSSGSPKTMTSGSGGHPRSGSTCGSEIMDFTTEETMFVSPLALSTIPECTRHKHTRLAMSPSSLQWQLIAELQWQAAVNIAHSDMTYFSNRHATVATRRRSESLSGELVRSQRIDLAKHRALYETSLNETLANLLDSRKTEIHSQQAPQCSDDKASTSQSGGPATADFMGDRSTLIERIDASIYETPLARNAGELQSIHHTSDAHTRRGQLNFGQVKNGDEKSLELQLTVRVDSRRLLNITCTPRRWTLPPDDAQAEHGIDSFSPCNDLMLIASAGMLLVDLRLEHNGCVPSSVVTRVDEAQQFCQLQAESAHTFTDPTQTQTGISSSNLGVHALNISPKIDLWSTGVGHRDDYLHELETNPQNFAVHNVGDRIEAQFGRGRMWFFGRVIRLDENFSAYDVKYDDGDIDIALPGRFVRVPLSSTVHERSKEQEPCAPVSMLAGRVDGDEQACHAHVPHMEARLDDASLVPIRKNDMTGIHSQNVSPTACINCGSDQTRPQGLSSNTLADLTAIMFSHDSLDIRPSEDDQIVDGSVSCCHDGAALHDLEVTERARTQLNAHIGAEYHRSGLTKLERELQHELDQANLPIKLAERWAHRGGSRSIVAPADQQAGGVDGNICPAKMAHIPSRRILESVGYAYIELAVKPSTLGWSYTASKTATNNESNSFSSRTYSPEAVRANCVVTSDTDEPFQQARVDSNQIDERDFSENSFTSLSSEASFGTPRKAGYEVATSPAKLHIRGKCLQVQTSLQNSKELQRLRSQKSYLKMYDHVEEALIGLVPPVQLPRTNTAFMPPFKSDAIFREKATIWLENINPVMHEVSYDVIEKAEVLSTCLETTKSPVESAAHSQVLSANTAAVDETAGFEAYDLLVPHKRAHPSPLVPHLSVSPRIGENAHARYRTVSVLCLESIDSNAPTPPARHDTVFADPSLCHASSLLHSTNYDVIETAELAEVRIISAEDEYVSCKGVSNNDESFAELRADLITARISQNLLWESFAATCNFEASSSMMRVSRHICSKLRSETQLNDVIIRDESEFHDAAISSTGSNLISVPEDSRDFITNAAWSSSPEHYPCDWSAAVTAYARWLVSSDKESKALAHDLGVAAYRSTGELATSLLEIFIHMEQHCDASALNFIPAENKQIPLRGTLEQAQIHRHAIFDALAEYFLGNCEKRTTVAAALFAWFKQPGAFVQNYPHRTTLFHAAESVSNRQCALGTPTVESVILLDYSQVCLRELDICVQVSDALLKKVLEAAVSSCTNSTWHNHLGFPNKIRVPEDAPAIAAGLCVTGGASRSSMCRHVPA